MITWSRLLAGRWRDPQVGRDILFGAAFGIVYCLLILTFEWIAARFGGAVFATYSPGNLLGARASAATIARLLNSALTGGLALFLMLFLLRLLLRKQWLAALVFVAVFTFNQYAQSQNTRPSQGIVLIAAFVLYAMIYGILVLIMLRFGFFALMTTLFVVNSTSALFLTTDFGAWYGVSSLIIVVFVSALALWGFRLSLAGRPLFSGAVLEQ
jgi:serine/threonine-protein kinase